MLFVVLVAQNLLQTLINAKTMGDSLDLSALVVLVVTMLGGVFGGSSERCWRPRWRP